MRKPPLDELRPTTPPTAEERLQVAREIESQAGVGLTRQYWTEVRPSPLGPLSRRAIAFTILGALLTCLVFLGAISWRLRDIPDPVILPFGDARTVMTHIHANFSGNKDPQFKPYFAPDGEGWFFTDAYTFGWLDASGIRQEVVVLSYADTASAETDYDARTHLLETGLEGVTIYRSPNLTVEVTSLAQRNAKWKGIRISNLVLLMTPTVSETDQQELYSHFISITAADHRDFIPTATPY